MVLSFGEISRLGHFPIIDYLFCFKPSPNQKHLVYLWHVGLYFYSFSRTKILEIKALEPRGKAILTIQKPNFL